MVKAEPGKSLGPTLLIAPGTWWSCLCWKEVDVKRKHLEFIHMLSNVVF